MGERLLTRAFVLVVLTTFGGLLSVGMLIPILPVFAEGQLEAGSMGVGLVVAAASPTAVVMLPIAGRLGDHFGRKPLVIIGCLGLAGSLLLCTVAASLPVLVALRLTSGVGEALLYVASATMVNDLAPPGRRGEAVSVYSLATWGGLAAGPPLGELILGEDRFDAVWLTAAAAAFAAALVGLGLTETRPSDIGPAHSSRSIVQRAALLPGVVLLLSMIGFACMAAFAPLYARELGLSGAGFVFALYAVIVISVRVLGRRIPDVVGPRRTATAATLIAAFGLTLIALVGSPAGLYLGTAVLACGHALVQPPLMMLVVSRAPVAERSSAVGSLTAFADLGVAIGALSLGAVAGVTGYTGAFVVAAVLAALGVLPLRRLRPSPAVPTPAVADTPP